MNSPAIAPFSYDNLPAQAQEELKTITKRVDQAAADWQEAGLVVARLICDARAVLTSNGQRGLFSAWLKERGLERRTAYRYLEHLAASEKLGLESMAAEVPASTAVLLAKDTTPEAVAEECLQRIRSGETVTTGDIRTRIEETKPKKDAAVEPRTRQPRSGSVVDVAQAQDYCRRLVKDYGAAQRTVTALAKLCGCERNGMHQATKDSSTEYLADVVNMLKRSDMPHSVWGIIDRFVARKKP